MHEMLHEEMAPQHKAMSKFSLQNIIASIHKMMWSIVSIIIMGFVVSIFVMIFVPLPKKGTIEIRPLNVFEVARYQDPAFDVSTLKPAPKEANKPLDRSFLNIDANLLYTIATDILVERSLIKQVLISNKIIEKRSDETDEEYESRLERATDKFEIKRPSPNPNQGSRFVSLSYTAPNAEIGYQVMRDLMKSVNEKTRAALIERFERNNADYLRLISETESDLKLRRANVLKVYDWTTSAQLAKLDEQIAVMKASGSRDGQMMSQSNQSISGQQAAVIDTNKMIYVPGYLQLEQTASLIRSRTRKEDFIPELINIDKSLQELAQDQASNRAIAAINRTLRSANDFRAVTFELSRSYFKASPLQISIGISIILFAFMIAAALVVFNILRRDAMA